MKDIINHLDEIEKTVLDELKDFQRATVERIDYLYRNGQKRILVSDEVGLGKTLIARGCVAKFANLRKEEGDDLVKVVYICSNATIADQNLDKLRIINEIKAESSNTSRLSMQHLNIFKEEHDAEILNKYIQLIPLTPDTSFRVTNTPGTIDERALMYAILKRNPDFKDYLKQLEKICRLGVKWWIGARDYFEGEVRKCDEQSDGEYVKYMLEKINPQLKTLKINDFTLLEFLKHTKENGYDKWISRAFIKKLRIIFADISLNKLEPDLIIMDEFQRFKFLLNTEENSEMGRLTNKFFNSDDLRILMLSATPYKMYSTLDEIDEDQIDAHYSEFFDVVDFLNKSKIEQEKFRDIWNNYSIKLKEFNHDKNSFLLAKSKAENALYKTICRTERISESQLSDIIDDNDTKQSLHVLNEDINSYIEAQKLLDDIGLNVNVPVDYIKSTPYIMSFMKEYQLKRKIERYFKENLDEIPKMNKSTFWLNETKIGNYEKIPYNNSRLEDLMGHVLKDNAANLLWVPPSKHYYELRGAFKGCDEFSKTLIFSSWEMVPRMISSLVSYEIERETVGRLSRRINYFSERRYPSPRMRFALKDDKPTQMSLFTLIYPSLFLIKAYNPSECLGLSLKEIEDKIKSKISDNLDLIPCQDTIREDLRWYYLAPLLLDSRSYVESWFEQSDRLVESGYYFRKGFLTHYNELKNQCFDSNLILGRKPDDLINVLCDMALAAPAICTYRAYEKELPQNMSMNEFRYAPTQIGRKFIDRMNLPESIAVIDLNFRSNSEDAYWKNVLKYAKDGNLQAVIDEYVHLLSNGLDKDNEDRILIINDKFLTSFEFRTASYDIDTYDTFKDRMNGVEYDNIYVRTHFAVSFTKGKTTEQDTNRKKSVRDAFNSPFRPFVLASTSIGQEGLDFHNYCRRIVHWNLPANPIDLEQREGRINRFECLAIRQNVAKRYGNIKFKSNDIWSELFNHARNYEKIDECSDLIPYWGLKESEDMVKIERIVPMYPFSRDELKYNRLIKILSLYRLTLGQARQEELLESIFNKWGFDYSDVNDLFINLSPYYKRLE